MDDLARLGMQIESDGVEKANQRLDTFEDKATRAEKATDALATASSRQSSAINKMMAEILKVAKAIEENTRLQRASTAAVEQAVAATDRAYGVTSRYAMSFTPLQANARGAVAALEAAAAADREVAIASGQATAVVARQAQVLSKHNEVVGLTRYQMLNLGRQFADVGVSIASGMPIWMVAIQQGAQIGETFAEARTQGVSFKSALGQVAGSIGGIITKFAPVAGVVGLAATAFGLFEREVDKNTKGATSWADTWQATVNVVGKAIMDGPIGDGLRWLGKAFGIVLDAIIDGVMWFVDKLVGHFGAAYELVVKNWRRLPEVFGVIAQGAANLAIQALEGLVNKAIDGINFLLTKAGKATLAHISLPEIKLANKELAADYERLASSIETSFRRGREGIFDKIVKETERLAAAHGKAAKAIKETADNTKLLTMAFQEAGPAVDVAIEGVELFTGALEKTEDVFAKMQNNILDGFFDMAGAAQSVAASVDDIISALRRGDGLAVGGGLINALSSIGRAFTGGGAMGGISAIASTGAGLLGGKAGSALGGLGLATGLMSMGGTLGTWATASAAAATAAGTAASAMASLAGTIAPLLGPIGIVAGLAMAVAPFLKGKPSNNAAIASISGDAYSMVSTGKETQETAGAAGQAAQAIIDAQKALKAFGATLTTTVTGIDLGTRDLTHVMLSTGQELRSAVGDPAAAVEAGLKAVLEGAQFADQGMQKLVDSMTAAGAGFDAITAQLQAYQQAQAAVQSLSDAIMQITDPAGFDRVTLERAQAARRAEYEAANAAGYYTADQFAKINEQLERLDALEIDKLVGSKVSEAASALTDAYNQQVSSLQSTIDKFQALSRSMEDFRASLRTGAMSGLTPQQQYGAARSAFNSISDRIRFGDVNAIDQVQPASQAFLQASMAVAPDAKTYARDLAAVRRLTEEAQALADAQVSIAQQQLDVMKATYENALAQTGQLQAINANLVSFQSALADYLKAATPVPAVNDNAAAMAVPAYAGGTSWHPGGIALVGEDGPEVVHLPRASAVSPNDELREALSGANSENVEAKLDRVIQLLERSYAVQEGTMQAGKKTANLVDRLSDGGEALYTVPNA